MKPGRNIPTPTARSASIGISEKGNVLGTGIRVEWVSERVNYAKRDLTPQEFIDLCNRVIEYRNGTVSSTETGVDTRTPVESVVRPTVVSLAASSKQEPSTESHGRFW